MEQLKKRIEQNEQLLNKLRASVEQKRKEVASKKEAEKNQLESLKNDYEKILRELDDQNKEVKDLKFTIVTQPDGSLILRPQYTIEDIQNDRLNVEYTASVYFDFPHDSDISFDFK